MYGVRGPGAGRGDGVAVDGVARHVVPAVTELALPQHLHRGVAV